MLDANVSLTQHSFVRSSYQQVFSVFYLKIKEEEIVHNLYYLLETGIITTVRKFSYPIPCLKILLISTSNLFPPFSRLPVFLLP